MKEKSRLTATKIAVSIMSILLVTVTVGWLVYSNFNYVLYLVRPDIYMKRALLATVEDLKVPVMPFMEDETVTVARLKLNSLTVDGSEKKGLVSATCGINFSPVRSEGIYGIDAYIGVGGIKMYSANVFVDDTEVLCKLSKSDNVYGFTWAEFDKLFDNRKSAYEYLNTEYDSFLGNFKEALKNSEVRLVDRDEKKFEVKVEGDNNPLPADEFTVYVNDDNKVYRLVADNFEINLSGDANIWEKFDFTYYKDGVADVFVEFESEFDTEDDFRASVKKLNVVICILGKDIEIGFSGSYGYNSMDFEIPTKPAQDDTNN